MKMRHSFAGIFAICTALHLISPAQAAVPEQAGPVITMEELRARCAGPFRSGAAGRGPETIRLDCDVRRRRWVAEGNRESFDAGSGAVLSARLSGADFDTTPEHVTELSMLDTLHGGPALYREVEVRRFLEITLTCSELLRQREPWTNTCRALLESAGQSSAFGGVRAGESTQVTGRILDGRFGPGHAQ